MVFKPLKEIKDEELGLKVGLEIHQQLDTGKLFCRCPSEVTSKKPDYIVKRKLKAIAGERGNIDVAASYEEMKDKFFIYECYTDLNCLVDIDEEPPHLINKDALYVGVQVAKMLNMKLFPQIQVMRKTVIDGSNTSGFQRTALFGIEGNVVLGKKNYRIQTICLEEDAAKIVSKDRDKTVYNLSRLGIPLIEIATHPDISNPEEARVVAEHLGMILRSTKKVKRGIGTIRQDLNISVKGNPRVEIKGCQELKLIPFIIRNEALRMINLIELSKYLSSIEFEAPKVKDISSIFNNTKSKIISYALDRGEKVFGFLLKEFNGLLSSELAQNTRIGSEIAGYAKAAGLGGIIHSDEDLSKYGLSDEEISEIEKRLDRRKKDAFFILIGEEQKLLKIIDEVILPRIEAFHYGPISEVRQANIDGTTTFMRPIPTSERMYPETDLPIFLLPENVELPKLLKEEIAELVQKYKLREAEAKEIVEKGIDFTKIVKMYKNLEPKFIAEAYINFSKDIKTRYNLDVDAELHIPRLLQMADKDIISKEAVFEALIDIAKYGNFDLSKYKKLSSEELKKIIREIIDKNSGLSENALMGEIMKTLRGKCEGKEIIKIIKELRGLKKK